MSRGLTLEGLSTTVFTRSNDDPAGDTQMQMQTVVRLPGNYIDVCRVLDARSQIALFVSTTRPTWLFGSKILSAMSEDAPAPPTVLQGIAFKATGKIRQCRAQHYGLDEAVLDLPELA